MKKLDCSAPLIYFLSKSKTSLNACMFGLNFVSNLVKEEGLSLENIHLGKILLRMLPHCVLASRK